MHKRFLRNIKDGTIYGWHPVLAENVLCQEVSEEEAFPERALKTAPVAAVVRRRKSKAAPPLDLSTEEHDGVEADLEDMFPDLGDDASRGLDP